MFGESALRGQEVSQLNQVIHGTTLKLIVKGQSYLEPGDLIEFALRPVDADKVDVEEDYRYAGQYVITKIRHRIAEDVYTMVLECAKDSIANPIAPGEPNHVAAKERGDLEDIHNNMAHIGYNRHS